MSNIDQVKLMESVKVKSLTLTLIFNESMVLGVNTLKGDPKSRLLGF